VTPKPPRTPHEPLRFALAGAPHVELGALLKLAGICDSGGEAKHLVQSGAVRVDGQVEIRRGKKLPAGSRVEARGRTILVLEGRAPPANTAGA
jgi:ribosome-associated protein